jgi:putative transposase
MLEIVTNRNCVYQTGYQVIWSPKYRCQILTGSVEETLKLTLTDICLQNNWSEQLIFWRPGRPLVVMPADG